MNWRMPMMTRGDKPPSDLELLVAPDGGREERVQLALIGPSAQGWIYRSVDDAACYRLLRIRSGRVRSEPTGRCSEDAPVDRRHEIKSWVGAACHTTPAAPQWTQRPKAYGLAPIVSADLADVGGAKFFYVCYAIRVDYTLLDVLNYPDPLARIDRLIQVLLMMPNWWNVLHAGLLPMPADVVFSDQNKPYLLPMPAWRFPDAESALLEPERCWCLAPEYVRGRPTPALDYNMDRYALGALFMRAFFKLPPAEDAEGILVRTANGSIWANLKSRLPFWLQELEPTHEALAAVRQLVDSDPHVRSAADPLKLAEKLADCRRRMEPRLAVHALLDSGQSAKAYTLVQEILLLQDSYEILLLAGRAAMETGHTLEAIDLLEKAITKFPHRREAYRDQFHVLISQATRAQLYPLIVTGNITQPDAGARIDEKLRRDFNQLEGDEQDRAEVEMAEHWLWRGHYDEAEHFIYPRLVRGNKLLWGKFGLRLAYVRAFIAKRRLDDAERDLDHITAALHTAFERRLLTHDEVRSYGDGILALKGIIAIRRREQ